MSEFVQQVHVIIKAGSIIQDKPFFTYMTPVVSEADINIPADKHYRDGKAIAKILRDMANSLEAGEFHFIGSPDLDRVIGIR